MSHWDAIIYGAGPAGAALARRLARKHSVLLLDLAPSPWATRRPVSWRIGESLPGAAAVLLDRLQLLQRFAHDGHATRGASVSTWDQDEPVWFDAVRDPAGPGWHLDRLRFDALLRAAATEAGATWATFNGRPQVLRAAAGWSVQDAASGQQHTATVLVDATGRRAALSRALGLRRRADDRLVCLHVRWPAREPDADRCTRVCADSNGWWYSVRLPAGPRLLALHLDADDPELHTLRDPNALLARARRLPLLRQVLPDQAQGGVTQLLPAGSAWLEGPACAGLYAVGDAQLAFDPIASQGLFHALASADSAARAIEGQLAGDASAAAAYAAGMHGVRERYRAHLALTYAGPQRWQGHRFWARRGRC